MITVFLHGFWGSPADWTPVLERLPLGHRTWCPDLYADDGLGPDVEPLAWADRFVHRARAEFGPEPLQLVGYSMGGRLGLHALLRVPGYFRRSLIVSSDPFTATDPQRSTNDEAWARRFETEPWDELAQAWERQGVLATSSPARRRRDESLRPRLAESLRVWSTTRHAFGAAELKSSPARIDWAFGARDEKYVGIGRAVSDLIGHAEVTIIPGAGHRVPHDAPEFIARWVSGA